MEMFDVKLEALIITKAFDELNAKEQAYVLEHITEVAYTNYHFILKKTVDAVSSDEKDLVPDPNISDRLKEHFNAKFPSARRPLYLNIFQSLTLYASVAAVAIVAILISLFMSNNPHKKFNTQTSKNINTQAIPIGIEKKTDKVQSAHPLLSHVKTKKNIRIAKIKKKKDTVVNKTPELLRTPIFEPLLCFDIDLQEQIPCLNDETMTNPASN